MERRHEMIPRRLSRTLISFSLGLILVCSVLFVLQGLNQTVEAAPAPPVVSTESPEAQAIIPVVTTIQAAIDSASPGDIVEFTGTYTEQVEINKSLTLRGTTPASTIVYNGAFPFPTDPTIRVTANVVTVTNLTLFGTGLVQHSALRVEDSSNVIIDGITVQDYPTGIEIQRTVAGANNITITNNFVSDSGGGATGQGGIYFFGTGAGTGSIQATVQGNHIFDYDLPPLLHADGLAPALISSNVLTSVGSTPDGVINLDQSGVSLVQNNTLNGASNSVIGIQLGNSANPTVTQNSIDSQFDFGIEVIDTAAPLITNSTISGHATYGVNIEDNAQPQIINSTLSSNLIAIEITDRAQPQILGNTITNGTGFAPAIQVSSIATPTIGFNQITDNPVGILLSDSVLLNAFGNTICGNVNVGLINGTSITQTVSGNWWGTNPPLDADATLPSDYFGGLNTSPISMSLQTVPTPPLVPINGTIDLTLTMTGGGQTVLDGTPISFSASEGSFTITDTTTVAGLANTTYNGTVLGTHTITATDQCGGVITTTVTVGEPIITAAKVAEPPTGSPIRPGETITYTIYVTNTGAFTGSNVSFYDALPNFTQLTTGTINSGVLTLTNPALALFDPIPPNNGVMSVTLTVDVTLPLTNGIVLTNSGVVSYANGTNSVITTTNVVSHIVQSSPILTLTKDAEPVPGSLVRPGELITYTLVVTNEGDANATDVVIRDAIPANTQLVTGTASSNVSLSLSDPLQANLSLPSSADRHGQLNLYRASRLTAGQ